MNATIRHLGRLLAGAALAGVMLGLISCNWTTADNSSANEFAWLMQYNAAASEAGDSVSFRIADVEDEESSALRSVPYGDREGYTGVFTGRREIRVFERDVSVAAASGIAELEEDQYYAAFVYSANNSIDQTVLVTRVPQEQEITSGKTRAQFVNLLTNTDSPEYIRAVRADTGTELATGVGRGRSSGYLELDPLDAAIRFLDESDTEVATAEGAELQVGRSYTVWLRGVQPDSTSFGGDPDETPVTVRVDRDHD